MSEYCMSHTGKELDDAINKVKSGYLNPDDILTHAKEFTTGYLQVDNDTSISDIEIKLGFKPKFFLIRNYGGIQSAAGSYYLTTSFFIADDEYKQFYELMSDEYNNYSRASMFTYYNSSKACAGQSNASANTFTATSNGVSGSGSSSIMLKGGNTYIYYAFG